MERRNAAPAAGGLEKSAEKPETKAWSAIRHTLGRLASRVGVRRIEDAARTIPASVLRTDLAWLQPPVSDGDGWKPSARVCRAVAPQAGMGLRESDLLPAVSVIREDSALAAPAAFAMPIAGAEILRVDAVSLAWPTAVIGLPDSFVRLPSSPVRVGSVLLPPPPKTVPLRAWPLTLPSVSLLRPADPRVRWGGDSVLRRMPLTRRGRETGLASGEGFAAGRRRLAETARLPPDEVALLGVYPDVPILAVERIVVEDEGRQLRLWLKPEVLRGRTGAHRIILLVGRQISTGKMLQAAL